jgi:nitroimidazol reductase NimA-like FMN-containing flavoprotein (pyridoxamine 5'-phosphate oxidase superfamily)
MITKMKALLRGKSSCVLATTDGETPHCSLMAYITPESADRLFLVTPRDTRKYRNIMQNPKVSLLIDTRDEKTTSPAQALVVAGNCRILEDEEEIATIKASFCQKHPHLKGLIHKGNVVFLCILFESFLLLDGPENAHHEILGQRRYKQGSTE